MRMYVGVTDCDWFKCLREAQPEEINFWQPSSMRTFHAITPGELFLFKLHAPNNYIVGGGWFVRQAFLPVSLLWDAFGVGNGRRSLREFLDVIYRMRKQDRRSEPDPIVSSLILASPFFLENGNWIPVPQNWAPGIMQGKRYDTTSSEGAQLFEMLQGKLFLGVRETDEQQRYGKPQIINPRLGQGSFRVIVTEVYHRRCAITNERTLPVLDASHIKPFAQDGPHLASNGLLLRQDIHTLFDRGYITINEDQIIEVSHHIREDYGNGKEYYAFHGKPLPNLPELTADRPSREFLRWHNENVYVG